MPNPCEIVTRINEQQPEMISRAADFAPTSWDDSERTIEMVMSTGARGLRPRWRQDPYEEELSMDPAHVDLSRINNHAPFLDVHNSWASRSVIGKIVPGSARIEDGKLIGRVKFADEEDLDEDGARTVRKIQKGILRNISIGYNVEQWRVTKAIDRKDGGKYDLYTGIRWSPAEASTVPIPFDDDSMTRSAVSTNHPNKERQMATPTEKKKPAEQIQTPPESRNTDAEEAKIRKEAAEAAAKQERERIRMIESRGAQLEIDDERIRKFIDDATPADEAIRAMLDLHAEKTEQERDINGSFSIEGGKDAWDKKRALIENAFMLRIDPAQTEPIQGNEFRDMTLMEIGKETLRAKGVAVTGSRARIAKQILTHRGAHSTSDFSSIFADTIHNALARDYKLKTPDFQKFCVREDLPDFLTRQVSHLSEFPDLIDIPEGGTYDFISASDGKESWKLAKAGWRFALTWESIVNDSIGAFSRLPTRLNAAALRTQSKVVWGIITANGKMGDGIALFHTASHKNLLSSGTVLGAAGLKAMRKLMKAQKGRGDIGKLELNPRFLLLPTGLYEDWQELISPNYQVTSANSVITGENKALEAIGSEYLEDDSASAFYICANPDEIDTIKFGFLQGEEGPVIEEKYGWETDGLEVKVRQSFGAAAADFRAFVKNPGSSGE